MRATLRVLLTVVLAASATLLTGDAPAARAQETWRSQADVVCTYEIDARLREIDRPRAAAAEPSPAAARAGEPDARPEKGLRIVGSESITWRNNSRDDVGVVYLHLYANAFEGTRSSFLTEAARGGWTVPDDMQWGGIDVHDLRLESGEELTLEFVAPDDGNQHDRTVARVRLPRPVPAGGMIGLRMRFATWLPTIVARMGRHRDFVMAAQWYPKLGRYVGRDAPNNREGWYCHQFHRATEFCADFADYDVRLSVAGHLVTGATGRLLASRDDGERGVREEHWQARGVVDFAWTASPEFVAETRVLHPFPTADGEDSGGPHAKALAAERARIAELLDVAVQDVEVPAVAVTLLLQPDHRHLADRHFEAARVALTLFGMWLGPYPYDRLTIVDPAHGARRAGGMEYPMLVTAGTRRDPHPASQWPETVVVHEIGHQWFMNLLATNEAEEAWLDEGLTTYFTSRAMHVAYGPGSQVRDVFGEQVPLSHFVQFDGVAGDWPAQFGFPQWARPPRMESFELWRDLPWLTELTTRRYVSDPLLPLRRRWLRRAGWDAATLPGWEFRDRRSYGSNAYARGALFTSTLRRRLHAVHGATEGERRFVAGIQRYAAEQRFRHPTAADFLRAFAAGSGEDPTQLFDELMAKSGVLDYAIEALEPVTSLPAQGRNVVPDRGGDDGYEGDDGNEPARRTAVVVRRLGEAVVPVRVEVGVRRADEDRVERRVLTWDGKERWTRLEVQGEALWARLHPGDEYLLDVSRSNDSRRTEPDRRAGVKWAVRFLNWLENAALSYGRFL